MRWAPKAWSGCPWAMWAKLVVSPQPGQGTPTIASNMHGGRPSCWWVPKPRASGSSQAAAPTTAQATRPDTAQKARVRSVRASGAAGAWGMAARGSAFITKGYT
jgi:hypothetical protein